MPPKQAQDDFGPLSDYERYLQRKLFKAGGEIPQEFWATVRLKLEADPPKVLAADLSGIKGEEWREVGASGQPAFANSWVNFGAGHETAAFYKDACGRVHLKGNIKSGTAVNTTAFTLPEGYRPAATLDFAVPSNGAFGQLRIGADGVVNPIIGSTVDFRLNVSFRAA